MCDGFVWRPTLDGVLVQPEHAEAFTIDRRAGRVLAALDRVRPAAIEESRLLTVLVGGPTEHADAAAWLTQLVDLFESVGLVIVDGGGQPTS
jgi:hypothetical protein